MLGFVVKFDRYSLFAGGQWSAGTIALISFNAFLIVDASPRHYTVRPVNRISRLSRANFMKDDKLYHFSKKNGVVTAWLIKKVYVCTIG